MNAYFPNLKSPEATIKLSPRNRHQHTITRNNKFPQSSDFRHPHPHSYSARSTSLKRTQESLNSLRFPPDDPNKLDHNIGDHTYFAARASTMRCKGEYMFGFVWGVGVVTVLMRLYGSIITFRH